VLALAIGGDPLGLSPTSTGALHLLVVGIAAMTGTALIERRVWAIAACDLTAFFIAAAWPAAFLPVTLRAHSVLFIGLAAILRA